MSYCYNKSLGGCEEKHSHSQPVAIRRPIKRLDVPSDKGLESENYSKRLRPRPTRQTERYKTTFSTPFSARHSSDHNQAVVQKCTSKRPAAYACTVPKAKVVKTNFEGVACIDPCASPSFRSLNESPSTHFTVNKQIKDISASTSRCNFRKSDKQFLKASSTYQNTGAKQYSAGKKKAYRSTLEYVKSPVKKTRALPRTEKYSPRKIYTPKLGITGFGTKTGSCASSRRGSEQSGQSPEVARFSDTSLQSETGRSRTSNHLLMRRSREASRGEDQIRRANDECEEVRDAGMASSGTAATSSNNESVSDDPDVMRLQALLESRGLPPRLFSNLGPRMQQVLHRSVGSGINTKTHQYMQGIQAEGDESQQLQSAIGMCQLLLMGNEDTLAGFPVKSAVLALTNLLKMEHNFDLMHHACRALTYMMESLPQSSGIIVDAIPILLEKLQTIQCIDVAEQSLTALDILSKRHASVVLAAGGLSSCLLYIDFFSLPAQRSALSVAANCCSAVGTLSTGVLDTVEQFRRFVNDSLSVLSSRLSHHDRKCVESTCLCFVRLIDGFQQNPEVISDIAAGDLLENFQRLLIIVPPILSTNMLVLVVHSMSILCYRQRTLALKLLKEKNIAQTLQYLLCGNQSDSRDEHFEVISRGSQEMLEITSFIQQLLPKLPRDDILFAINSIYCLDGAHKKSVIWQWKDDIGQWQPYNRRDSRILEMAFSRGEHDVDLRTDDHTSTVNFQNMWQMYDITDVTRAVQRTLTSEDEDSQLFCEDVKPEAGDFSHFVNILIPILSKVYISSAGYPPVRHACLQCMNQMVYFTEPKELPNILCKIPLSSQISSMLSSPDFQIIVRALQLAELIMRKVPDVFAHAFRREGIVHRVEKLSCFSLIVKDEENTKTISCGSRSIQNNNKDRLSSHDPLRQDVSTNIKSSSTKYPSNDAFSRNKTRSSRVTKLATSFFTNINPSAWGKTISSALGRDGCSTSNTQSCEEPEDEVNPSDGKSSSNVSDTSRGLLSKDASKRTIEWIRSRAGEFLENHFKEASVENSGMPSVLDQMTTISINLGESSPKSRKILENLRDLFCSAEVSPFEIIQSGIVTSVLRYLTLNSSCDTVNTRPNGEPFTGRYDLLNSRIRLFLSVYAGLPADDRDEAVASHTICEYKPLLNLIHKLNQCVGRLEQFSVKSRDLICGRAHVLRVLTTRQLKCQLQRHPECQSTKRWLGGPIKVDPLLQMRAVERYLLMKGYDTGTLRKSTKPLLSSQMDDQEDSDSESHSDIYDLSMNAEDSECIGRSAFPEIPHTALGSMEDFRHVAGRQKKASQAFVQRLEFYVNNHKIPHHVTVYQALEQYGQPATEPLSVNEAWESCFTLLDNTSFWNKTHLIQYRLKQRELPDGTGSSQFKLSKKVSATRRLREQCKSSLWSDGILPAQASPLHRFLVPELTPEFTTKDPCVEVLCLLRVINAICRYWYYLYSPYLVQTDQPLVMLSEFVNNEINVKCMHQLNDPLIILTSQLSAWIKEIARVCPFTLSFGTRQLLFKVTAVERDRAMQHLLDTGLTRTFSTHLSTGPNNSQSSTSNHFMPRIEKRKYSVSRKNLLQQAEKVITEHGHSPAMIEVDYENEVGTGLGPTLEFFTLTSVELQNPVLKLWREDLSFEEQSSTDNREMSFESPSCEKPETRKQIASSVPTKGPTSDIKLVKCAPGIFPRPIGYAAKHSHTTRIAGKFRFLGKFLARALLDGRLVDIPLSVVCYKWLLGEELALTGLDLEYIDPELSTTYRKFCKVAHNRELIIASHPEMLGSLEMDGCLIEDLSLDFRLPGYPNVELMKMGKNTPVTAYNLDKYIDLIPHWTLFEGVKHQMSALKDGFESVLPLSSLCYFYAEELDQLFCGSRYRKWKIKELSETCHPDHGYTQESATVKALYRILSSYSAAEQREFLQFVTGCPHLPVGGLHSLNPPLTVVRKACDDAENPDDFLPSVMTCLNYLKLPEYSSEDVMKGRLRVAVQEGQKSFLLS